MCRPPTSFNGVADTLDEHGGDALGGDAIGTRWSAAVGGGVLLVGYSVVISATAVRADDSSTMAFLVA